MNSLHFRPYAAGDKDACMAIFLSNMPRYFGVEETDDYRTFLDAPSCDYFVVTHNNNIVACGGHGFHNDKGAFVLVWGMVHADMHKQGLGKFLLSERLKRIHRDFGESLVIIETSQHSKGFFERFGFVVTNTIENHFAPGIDRVDMELRLTSEQYRSLFQQEVG